MSAPFERKVFESEGLVVIDDQGAVDEPPRESTPPRAFRDVALTNVDEKTLQQMSQNAQQISADARLAQSLANRPQYQTRCRNFFAGYCKFGDRCHYSHDLQSSELRGEGDQECAICMEFVEEKGERYGLLLNCPHAFCLPCIREWRAAAQKERDDDDAGDDDEQTASTATVRSCPLCRVFSPYVIPSTYFVSTETAKQKLQAQFLANTSSRQCRFWSGKPGSCQFGSSCHYKHINPDGTIGIDATRSFVNEFGEIEVKPAVDNTKLSDFIKLDKKKPASPSNGKQTNESLPKWARGLDDEQVEQISAAMASTETSDNVSTSSNAVAKSATVKPAKGFVEIDLQPVSSSSNTSASTKTTSQNKSSVAEWTADEQRLLEEALTLFPGAASDKERWAKIAAHVGRSRKECVMRFRYCANLVAEK